MKNRLYAKSNGESIKTHTQKLLHLYNDFENLYGYKLSQPQKEGIALACKYHDIGKCNSRFQNKIMKVMGMNESIGQEFDDLYKKADVIEIPHGYFSAITVDFVSLKEKYGRDYACAVITAICNHHNRYLETKNCDKIDEDKLKKILKSEMEKYKDCFDIDFNINAKLILHNRIEHTRNKSFSNITDEQWLKFAYFKGMLNKFDYGASGDVETVEIPGENATENVQKFFDKKGYKLNDCQNYMLAHQNDNIVVIASTGIGKTEAALLWQGNEKTFYTLPIKVAINAIYDRIVKENNYYSKEKTAFLHSDTLSILLNDKENDKKPEKEENVFDQYNKIKTFSYPFTICTVDQLFIFVYKALGTEIMPATLSYSKIIIDEIQSYSPELIAKLIYGLKIITDLGGKFCIMTATLPPCIVYFLKKAGIKFEQPDKPFLKLSRKTGNPMVRHCIKLIDDDFDYENIVNQSKNKKVLVIVNTVNRAQEVYKTLSDMGTDVNLLHSRFKQEDKKAKEIEIQDFAPSDKEECEKNKNSGVWVSTQIVEASLDIDFDFLHTDMCTADSLLQRMGRCYRNRDFDLETANIYIYNTKIGRGDNSIYNSEIYDRSWDCLLNFDGVFTESDKINYINKVFNTEEIKKTSYYRDIRTMLCNLKNLYPAFIEKSEAKKHFRDIQNYSLLLYEDYNNFRNNGYIEKLESKIPYEQKLRLLDDVRKKSITVSNLYRYKEYLSKSEIKGFFVVQCNYSYEFGLSDEADESNFC